MSAIRQQSLDDAVHALAEPHEDDLRRIWLVQQMRDRTTAEQVFRHLHREESLRLRPRSRFARLGRLLTPRNTTVAAALLLAAAGAGAYALRSPEPPPPEQLTVAPYSLNGGAAQLPDGSHVMVSPTGTVAVARDADGNTGLTLQRGAVTCEVVHQDTGRHFTVSTIEGEVRVIGTGFTVEQQDGLTTVNVDHGRVEVHDRTSGQTLVLGAGDQARLHPPCMPEKIPAPTPVTPPPTCPLPATTP